MTKFFKPAGIAVSILAILVIFIFATAWFVTPESGIVSRSLENYLSETSGLKISISSSALSYDFPGLLSISFNGVEIKDDSDKRLFSAQNVILWPSLRGLLGGQFIIKSVLIDDFWTEISRDDKGRIAAPFFSSIAPITKAETASTHRGISWTVQTVALTNGRIDWFDIKTDEGNPVFISATGIEGSVQHSVETGSVRFKLDSRLGDNPGLPATVNLEGHVDIDWSLPGVRSAKLDFFFKSQQVGFLANYIKHDSVSSQIKGLQFKAQVNFDPVQDLGISVEAIALTGETPGHELKFTSTGSVKAPFSDAPVVDFSAGFFSKSSTVANFFRLNDQGIGLGGSIGVKGRISGNLDSLSINLEIDPGAMSASIDSSFLKCHLKFEKALARVNAKHIGRKNFSFDGKGTLVPNFKGKDSGRENIRKDFHLDGDASANIKFRGNPDKTEWSLASDMARLSVETRSGFRKQHGSASSLDASGEYSPKGLALRKCTIVFPGLTLNAKGSIRDTRGVFGPMIINAEVENLGTTFSGNATVKKLGISGGSASASLVVRGSTEAVMESGGINFNDVECKPEKAAWSLTKVSGQLAMKGSALAISGLTGRVLGHVQAPFKVTGVLEDFGSANTMKGKVTLKLDSGKVKADGMVRVMTEAHSVLGNMIKPRPLAMDGNFISFDRVESDLLIKSGIASTQNFQMHGDEIACSAIGSTEIDTLNLNAIMAIRTSVVGSDTLESVPFVGEMMQRHRDRLIRIPVTMFAGLTGPLLSYIQIQPLQEGQIDKRTLEKLHEMLRVKN